MTSRLAWIGLGNMGVGMCKNLVTKGEYQGPVIVYNRTTTKATTLNEKLPPGSSKAVESIAEAINSSDIIFTCLGDDKSVIDTYQTIASIGSLADKLLVDCSTVHPDTTEKLEQLVVKQDGAFVACPVFGAPPMAEAGQLVCVLAGPKEHVDKVKPFTTGVMGRSIIDYSGQRCSRALLLKIIGNTFVLSMVESLAQGHTLAEKAGLGNQNLHEFIEALFPGPFTAYSNRLMSGDYYTRDPPLFAVDLAIKDANHALTIADSSGARIRSTEMATEHLQDVKKTQGAKGDIAGIYGVVRQESGLPYKN